MVWASIVASLASLMLLGPEVSPAPASPPGSRWRLAYTVGLQGGFGFNDQWPRGGGALEGYVGAGYPTSGWSGRHREEHSFGYWGDLGLDSDLGLRDRHRLAVAGRTGRGKALFLYQGGIGLMHAVWPPQGSDPRHRMGPSIGTRLGVSTASRPGFMAAVGVDSDLLMDPGRRGVSPGVLFVIVLGVAAT